MKDKIHPQYNDKIEVTCSCGNSFETGSTAAEIKVEVCSNCHPFYTGKQKLVDVAGRVDSFKKKLEKVEKTQTASKDKKKRNKKDDDTVKIAG